MQIIQSQPTTNPKAIAKIRWGMFFGGFSAFTLLYACQPLMPMLSAEFNLNATQASWVLSISMISLAISLLVISFLSNFINHVKLMSGALLAAAIAMLFSATSSSFNELLCFRALLGIALGGLPAVAELIGWRSTFLLLGISGVVSALLFIKLLSLAEKNVTTTFQWNFLSAISKTLKPQLQQPAYWALFAIGFFLTGSFTGLFNYINFRLQQSPYEISQSALSSLTLLYIFGIWSSFCSARIVARLGYARAITGSLTLMLIGLWITSNSGLLLIILGISIFTFGFL